MNETLIADTDGAPSAEEKAELLLALTPGTPVRTWDNAFGVVAWSTDVEVGVRFPHLTVGAGPWTYERYQVVAVGPKQRQVIGTVRS